MPGLLHTPRVQESHRQALSGTLSSQNPTRLQLASCPQAVGSAGQVSFVPPVFILLPGVTAAAPARDSCRDLAPLEPPNVVGI